MEWINAIIIVAFFIGCLAAFGGGDEHY